jgi:hypothetical protein
VDKPVDKGATGGPEARIPAAAFVSAHFLCISGKSLNQKGNFFTVRDGTAKFIQHAA